MEIKHMLGIVFVVIVLWCQDSNADNSVNIALGKPVTMSSTLNYKGLWHGMRMVDGNTTTEANACNCCASTDETEHPWITIDLLQEYSVVKVIVRGRTDNKDAFTNLKNLQIVAGNFTSTTNFSNNVQQNRTLVTATGNRNIRTLTLKRPKGTIPSDKWFLVVCEVEIYTYISFANIALGKTVKMSTRSIPYYTQDNPAYAVDGKISTDIDKCSCCSSTSNELRPWLTVDLQQVYRVVNVIVKGRVDDKASEMSRNLEHLQCIYRNHETDEQFPYLQHVTINSSVNTVMASGPVSTQFITLRKPAPNYQEEWYLVVCEVEVYVIDIIFCNHKPASPNNEFMYVCCKGGFEWTNRGVSRVTIDMCPDGYYGNCSQKCGQCVHEQNDSPVCDKESGWCKHGCEQGYIGNKCDEACPEGFYGNCSQSCGHCLPGEVPVCDKRSGACLYGCEQGYKGTKCVEECNDGTYGNCFLVCGQCASMLPCDHVTGHCKGGCNNGYKGERCDQSCNNGTYGSCYQTCGHCVSGLPCDHVTGKCHTGCKPGYTGDRCTEGCDDGWYGLNCNQRCGKCVTTCHNVTGKCPQGCDPGYTGDKCDELCDNYRYGHGCNQICGSCADNKTCHHINGSCLNGCAASFVDSLCQTQSQRNEADETIDSTTIIAVSVSAGLVFLAGIVIVLVVVFIVRRKRTSTNRGGRVNKSEKNMEDVTIVHDSPVIEATPEEEAESDGKLNQAFSADETDKELDYYSFDSVRNDHNTVFIRDLWGYIRDRQANCCEAFYKEYKGFPSELQYAHKVAHSKENKGKNRYREIVAYDHSRVKLKGTSEGQTDYINASYVDGYERVKKFIASQGPTKATIADFWRMVWQQKSTKIVMLTNIVEMGKDKCERYWPEAGEKGEENGIEEGEEATYGDVTVRLLHTDKQLDFTIRTLKIAQGTSTSRKVTQFHFKSWPDKDVPDSAWCLVQFWRRVNETKNGKQPMIVHCSAGVGRTGTFVGLDFLYEQARAEGGIRPLQMLETLRRQRVKLVQTKEQYAFLHGAVAEALLLGTHFYWPRELPDVYTYIQGTDAETSKSRLQLQYQLLCQSVAAMTNGEATKDQEYGNVETSELEEDGYMSIGTTGRSSLVLPHTLTLNNVNGAETFIATLAPDEHTLDDFWAQLRRRDAKTIINLSGEPGENPSVAHHLGTDGKTMPKKFTVNMTRKKAHRGFTERTFTFMENDGDENDVTTVKQYDLTCWKRTSPNPDDTLPVLLLLDELFRWQAHLSEAEPLILYCSGDITRCGLLVAILNEVLRMRFDDYHVNIVDTVIRVKKSNPCFVSYEQYQFLHDVIISHVKRSGMAEYSGVYSNI